MGRPFAAILHSNLCLLGTAGLQGIIPKKRYIRTSYLVQEVFLTSSYRRVVRVWDLALVRGLYQSIQSLFHLGPSGGYDRAIASFQTRLAYLGCQS